MKLRSRHDDVEVIVKKTYANPETHGGAWKVAYADFVTAMMAFFLLLWLLNAATRAQVVGIAEFFAEKTLVDNENVTTPDEGSEELEGIVEGIVEPLRFESSNSAAIKFLEVPSNVFYGNAEIREQQTLSLGQSNPDILEYEDDKNSGTGVPLPILAGEDIKTENRTSKIELIKQGLVVQVADESGVFVEGTDQLNDLGRRRLAQLNNTLLANEQGQALFYIEGHSSVGASSDVWLLSVQRGYAVLKWMLDNQFDQSHILSVSGFGDSVLLDGEVPSSQINDRVVIRLVSLRNISGITE